MKIMNSKTILFAILSLMPILALSQVRDTDMDGVPDTIDRCKQTPFLDEVDKNGCTTKRLVFPQERQNGSLELTAGYGYNVNDDDIHRTIQHSGNVQLTYYSDHWIYAIRSGYFHSSTDHGAQDTTLKIKRRFKITPDLKLSAGAAVRLPTYHFPGNRTDVSLYGSAVYYPVDALSVFAGANHTFIRDVEQTAALQDTNTFYGGIGYFFTEKSYANIAYSFSKSKFAIQPPIKSVVSTLFYQINTQWFVAATYSKEINTFLKHDTFNIVFGYKIW